MPTLAPFRQKIARLATGANPRVLDVFSGCGGMSLGFQAAGFEITAAVEVDRDAARSHGANFHSGRAAHSKARDITSTTPDDLTAELCLGDADCAFDVIIGGPPCQAFARVGRSKLREIADHPEAFRHDPRSRLYIDYLRYVEACAPLAVVMENVPDMMNHAGHNIAAEVCEVLEERGYRCIYTLLNAALFGVPQMRERMILVAVRNEISCGQLSVPAPTNWITLPSGYEGSRAVALKLLAKPDLAGLDCHYRPALEASANLPAAVTAEEALGDLPPLNARVLMSKGLLRRGARRLDVPMIWETPAEITDYALAMRNWPGFGNTGAVTDHVIRYLPRDYALFARLKPGDQYPQALAQAEKMFKAELRRRNLSGEQVRSNTKAWRELRANIIPPYDDGKFPNKWRKMEADKPARTLLAHLGKDGYSHIHYDSRQARTISVREAARLQSFPDGFHFCGTMNSAFRQIGNAVPPLLAKVVGAFVKEQLSRSTLEVSSRRVVAGSRR